MFSWLTKILFGPHKPVVACDQPPQPVQVVVDDGSTCHGVLHPFTRTLRCPGCDHEMNGVLGDGRGAPGTKNYVSCLRCGQLLVLTIDGCGGELELRGADDGELDRVKRGLPPAAWREVEDMQRRWRDWQLRRVSWPQINRRSRN